MATRNDRGSFRWGLCLRFCGLVFVSVLLIVFFGGLIFLSKTGLASPSEAVGALFFAAVAAAVLAVVTTVASMPLVYPRLVENERRVDSTRIGSDTESLWDRAKEKLNDLPEWVGVVLFGLLAIVLHIVLSSLGCYDAPPGRDPMDMWNL